MSGKTRAELVAELEEMDPDYLVDVLGISSDELIDAFPRKVRTYVNDMYTGDVEEEEDDNGICDY